MLPESAKPQVIERRLLQGLLPLSGHGIDVGAGQALPSSWRWWEKLGMDCRPWDLRDGDGAELATVPDGSLDWLYSSHCLEHLSDPDRALRNWVRVVRPGGRLLIAVPHRNLYERRRELPSRWNPDHRRFYLPWRSEGPHTVGLWEWLAPQQGPLGFRILTLVTGDWGNSNTQDQHQHPDGEYQIDALLERL